MNDTIYKKQNGDFETSSFRETRNKPKRSPEDVLVILYALRVRLYKKGGNDEVLNDKIRALQKETNYQVRE